MTWFCSPPKNREYISNNWLYCWTFTIYAIYLVLPLRLTELLRKVWFDIFVSYRHQNSPWWSLVTLGMLKVTELESDDWVILNDPEVRRRINVPLKGAAAVEQVMLTCWPQVTEPAGLIKILGCGKFAGK